MPLNFDDALRKSGTRSEGAPRAAGRGRRRAGEGDGERVLIRANVANNKICAQAYLGVLPPFFGVCFCCRTRRELIFVKNIINCHYEQRQRAQLTEKAGQSECIPHCSAAFECEMRADGM